MRRRHSGGQGISSSFLFFIQPVNPVPIIIGKSAKPWGPRSVQQVEDMEPPFAHGTCVLVGRYTIHKKTEFQMVISIAKIML